MYIYFFQVNVEVPTTPEPATSPSGLELTNVTSPVNSPAHAPAPGPTTPSEALPSPQPITPPRPTTQRVPPVPAPRRKLGFARTDRAATSLATPRKQADPLVSIDSSPVSADTAPLATPLTEDAFLDSAPVSAEAAPLLVLPPHPTENENSHP